MEVLRSKILFCCFFILFLVACPVRGQEVEDESEFNYDPKSPLGPANWGNIRPEWRTCNTGRMQSPIDLVNDKVEIVSDLGRLQTAYKPSNATLINRGHDVMLRWVNGGGNIRIDGTSYQLDQVHWHSPTEHSIDGKRFALEAHLVHASPNGRAAVTGILYKIGRPDPFLSTLEKDLKAIADTRNREKGVGIVDPNRIKVETKKYYRYIGSLTTPPCTEDVVWTIYREVRTVSKYQVQLLREAVNDDSENNARPIQALNGRTVQLYSPKHNDED